MLRSSSSNKFTVAKNQTKFGDLKFDVVFTKYLNKIEFYNLFLEQDKFKTAFNNNLKNFVNVFVLLLPKFDVTLNNMYILK